MSLARVTLVAFATLVLATRVPSVAVAALFTLTDDGATFLYTARPGDSPGRVAEMFGVPLEGIDALLAANGISDPTRVGPGFVYRIPNAAARELATRTITLKEENARLQREVDGSKERGRALVEEAEERSRTLAHELAEARSTAASAESRALRLTRLEDLWPVAQVVVLVLLVIAAGTTALAVATIRRQRQAERYARSLAAELEEKRRGGLLERQESAKRILELETRLRTIEAQLGPKVLVGGRGS